MGEATPANNPPLDSRGLYLDPYARPAEKRGGAWLDECVGESRLLRDGDDRARLPVATLVFFVGFRGREPRTGALLQLYGLLAA